MSDSFWPRKQCHLAERRGSFVYGFSPDDLPATEPIAVMKELGGHSVVGYLIPVADFQLLCALKTLLPEMAAKLTETVRESRPEPLL